MVSATHRVVSHLCATSTAAVDQFVTTIVILVDEKMFTGYVQWFTAVNEIDVIVGGVIELAPFHYRQISLMHSQSSLTPYPEWQVVYEDRLCSRGLFRLGCHGL